MASADYKEVAPEAGEYSEFEPEEEATVPTGPPTRLPPPPGMGGARQAPKRTPSIGLPTSATLDSEYSETESLVINNGFKLIYGNPNISQTTDLVAARAPKPPSVGPPKRLHSGPNSGAVTPASGARTPNEEGDDGPGFDPSMLLSKFSKLDMDAPSASAPDLPMNQQSLIHKYKSPPQAHSPVVSPPSTPSIPLRQPPRPPIDHGTSRVPVHDPTARLPGLQGGQSSAIVSTLKVSGEAPAPPPMKHRGMGGSSSDSIRTRISPQASSDSLMTARAPASSDQIQRRSSGPASSGRTLVANYASMTAEQRKTAAEKAPWYYKDLSRIASEKILGTQPLGSFLVRESSTQAGQKVIVVKGHTKVLSYLVFTSTRSGLLTLGKSEEGCEGFVTLISLLHHYLETPLPRSDGGRLVLTEGVIV